VYVSEIYQLLSAVPGIDFVVDVSLSSSCPPGAARCQAAEPEWHPDGELVGLMLAAHHLPWAQVDPRGVVFGTHFLAVNVNLHITRCSCASANAAARAARAAVRELFHPLHGGPDGTREVEISTLDIRSAVERLPDVARVDDVSLSADLSRVRFDE